MVRKLCTLLSDQFQDEVVASRFILALRGQAPK
jgi:hypothetical protein